MCDGTTALNSQITGGITAGIGAYYTAKGEQNNYKASANIADTNARLDELTAQSALQRGQLEEQASRISTSNTKEAQRVAFAANGISLDSDTANRVLTSTDVLGEIDANTIRANAARSAWGYRTQAVQDKNEALIKRASAKSISPFSRAKTSLINSAGPIADTWYKYGKEGGLKGSPYGYIYDHMNKGV